jgi:hypothetical protein
VEPSSIAQDEEDEVSGKNTRGDQLGNMVVAQDEDGENIGAAASMEDHSERKGTEVAGVQAIVDMDDDTIKDKISSYFCKHMSERRPYDFVPSPFYEPHHQLTEVYEQQAFYRIRGYKVTSYHYMNRVKTAGFRSMSHMYSRWHQLCVVFDSFYGLRPVGISGGATIARTYWWFICL